MMYYNPATDGYEETQGVDGAINVRATGGTAAVSGVATGGSSTTIVDTSKNWETNSLVGKTVKLFSSTYEIYRKIISNTANTITTAAMIAAINGTAVLFDGYSYEVTATGAAAAAAAAGNDYNFVVVAGDGNDVNLSAVLAVKTVTVTLGTDGSGDLDAAKNTATLIAAAIDALDDFTAAATGATASDPATTLCTIAVSGGADAYGGRVDDRYEVLGDTLALSGSNTYKKISDTITIGTGAAHHAGDVVSTDAGEILAFDCSSWLAAGASGIILDSLVTLGQNAVFSGGAGYTLRLFNASPTAQATNAAYDLAAADEAKYIGKIDISTLVDDTTICTADDIGHNRPFQLASGSTTIYGKLICKGAETTISDKVLTIKLGIAAL